METKLELIAAQLRLNRWVIDSTLQQTRSEDFLERPGERANSMHWIFGHITATRCGFARLLGLNFDFTGSDRFRRGAGLEPADKYTAMPDIQEAFTRVCDGIEKRLASMTDAELATAPANEFPGMENTIYGALTFMSFHESYHIGQIHVLRRMLGNEPMFG